MEIDEALLSGATLYQRVQQEFLKLQNIITLSQKTTEIQVPKTSILSHKEYNTVLNISVRIRCDDANILNAIFDNIYSSVKSIDWRRRKVYFISPQVFVEFGGEQTNATLLLDVLPTLDAPKLLPIFEKYNLVPDVDHYSSVTDFKAFRRGMNKFRIYTKDLTYNRNKRKDVYYLWEGILLYLEKLNDKEKLYLY